MFHYSRSLLLNFNAHLLTLSLTDRVLFCVRIADSVSTIGSELSFYWVLFLWCQMCGWGLCVCGEEEEVLKMKLLEEDNAES